MSNIDCSIENFNSVLTGVLNEYNQEVIKDVKKQTKRAMKDLVDNTKADAPVGDHDYDHYRDYITSRTVKEDNQSLVKMWYVRDGNHRLSHLLNNGHALRDGGRYPGTNFIGKNVDRIITWYLTAIEEAVKK